MAIWPARQTHARSASSPRSLAAQGWKALPATLSTDAREARDAARCVKALLLAQTYRHSDGRTVRNRRDVAAVERYRAEYQHVSRKALEEAT